MDKGTGGSGRSKIRREAKIVKNMYFAKRTHFRLRLRYGETVFAVTKAASEDWRRGRDSNPRDACAPNGFQDRRIRPLCHLSVAIKGPPAPKKYCLSCSQFNSCRAILKAH